MDGLTEAATSPSVVAGWVAALSGPLVTAGDQPPPPGSNWLVRGWHWLRRLGGRALDALPKRSTTGMLIVRLVMVVLAWTLICLIVLEVLTFWVAFVLPFQLLARGRKRSKGSQPGALSQPVATAGGAMAPDQTAAVLWRRISTAPDPDPVPAVDACPVCGGPTAKSSASCCSYCRSPLPMITKRGWHPDPLGTGSRRWFDGGRWTEHTSRPE